jgi:tRNA dimethylallyltransferase
MDIGTAKVSKADRDRVPHRNIDILDPGEPDSAAAYTRRSAVWESEADAPAFHVGGSTLHLQSVVWPLSGLPEADAANQSEITDLERRDGPDGVLKRLRAVDPAYAATLQGYNRQRAFRALDVWMQTGKPFSDFHQQDGFIVPDDVRIVVLTASNEERVRRIHARVDAMIREGLVDEVDRLLKSGVSPEAQSMRTVGYRELIPVLQGSARRDDAIEAIRTATRQYAKRQLTWFRRWQGAVWIERDGLGEEALLERFETAILRPNP